MAATDEELQKLGKPPICSGKDDEWSEWSVVVKSYASLCPRTCQRCWQGAEDTATSPDMSMTRIRATLTEDDATAAKKTLPRLGDERLAVNRHERSTSMASVDHEIRSKHSAASTKSRERNPQCEDFTVRAHGL